MARISAGRRAGGPTNATGLAASNNLSGQTAGIDLTQANAQDGISLVQTAASGLDTIQTLLQRLRKIAVQSADQNISAEERQGLQAEADQIAKEINQSATSTSFNAKGLLDGSLSSSATAEAGSSIPGFNAGLTSTPPTVTLAGGTLASGTYSVNVNSTGKPGTTSGRGTPVGPGRLPSADSFLSDRTLGFRTDTSGARFSWARPGDYTLNVSGHAGSGASTVTLGTTANTGDTFQSVIDKVNLLSPATGVMASWPDANDGIVFTNGRAGSAAAVTVSGSDLLLKGLGIVAPGNVAASATSIDTISAYGTDGSATLTPPNGQPAVLAASGNKFTDTTSGFEADLNALTTPATSATDLNGSATVSVVSKGASMQIGANPTPSNQLTLLIGDMRAAALGIQGSAPSAALDVSTSSTVASSAIKTIDAAIQTVASQSAALNSIQGRLSAGLDNIAATENTAAAYTTIIDSSAAQQLTDLATAQIRQQPANAMQAQANQTPQGVLRLLGEPFAV